jgi:hypothetical protein
MERMGDETREAESFGITRQVLRVVVFKGKLETPRIAG